jgi:hypothetical protein
MIIAIAWFFFSLFALGFMIAGAFSAVGLTLMALDYLARR